MIDEKWDEIRAAAAHKLLCASGDYMLDADKYRLPPQSQRVGSQPPQLTRKVEVEEADPNAQPQTQTGTSSK